MVANATAISGTKSVSTKVNDTIDHTGATEPISLTLNGHIFSYNQLETAHVQLSKDGKSYIISPKEDIPVEVLKEIFGIEDGAFREILKKQVQDGFDNGVFVEDHSRLFGLIPGKRFNYSRAILYSDQTYKIPVEKLKSQR